MKTCRNKGGALLAVLWLSAALSAIAFSLASTVRSEVERASTAVDGLRSYYLAEAGVERGILYLEWQRQHTLPLNPAMSYSPATPVMPLSFPSGQTVVEVIPETAKLNINTSPDEDLIRLVMALGAGPERAAQIAAAIIDWRTPGGMTQFDAFYQSLTPSFRARHASFEETEELLLVRGMTPDLYYGGYNHDSEGRLTPHGGLRDCVSVFNATNGVDVNTAQPAVLAAIGIPPDAVSAIVARRSTQPFASAQELGEFAAGGREGFGRLRMGGNSIFTIRSTARILLPNGQFSDVRRTMAATVKFMPYGEEPRTQILRWYDNAWTP